MEPSNARQLCVVELTNASLVKKLKEVTERQVNG